MESDFELIQRVREHDGEAFDELFARHGQAVQGHLLRMVRDAGIAEDLTQEVFLRLWTRAEQWEGRGLLAGWLLRIGTNLALNYFRGQRRARRGVCEAGSQELEGPPEERQSAAGGAIRGGGDDTAQHLRAMPETTGDRGLVPDWLADTSAVEPGEMLDRTEQGERLRELVAQLPEEKREVLRLVYDEEMDLQEVAERLGIPQGTVKSRLHHARARLARQWGELQNGSED